MTEPDTTTKRHSIDREAVEQSAKGAYAMLKRNAMLDALSPRWQAQSSLSSRQTRISLATAAYPFGEPRETEAPRCLISKFW